MEPLTLAQLFGVNASQNNQALIIRKSDLFLLTPSANNRAESLFAALMLTALQVFQGYLTDDYGNAINDDENQPITFDNSDIYEFLKVFHWRKIQVNRHNQKYILDQLVVGEYAEY